MASKKTGLITGSPATGNTGSDDVFKKVFERIQTGILLIDPAAHIIVDTNPMRNSSPAAPGTN
jgi:hypothetical protein